LGHAPDASDHGFDGIDVGVIEPGELEEAQQVDLFLRSIGDGLEDDEVFGGGHANAGMPLRSLDGRSAVFAACSSSTVPSSST
jgi:hypothetical protein